MSPAREDRPSGTVWDAIGVAAGENYYFLPASGAGAGGAGALAAPYLGIGAEEVSTGHFDGDTLTLTLTGASMPGTATFSLWENGMTDPTFYMTTADGISSADSITVAVGSHAHYNWGFSEAGTYELEFTVSGYVDGTLTTDTATYTFTAVPEPATTAAIGGSAILALVLLLRLRGSRTKPSV